MEKQRANQICSCLNQRGGGDRGWGGDGGLAVRSAPSLHSSDSEQLGRKLLLSGHLSIQHVSQATFY